MKSTLLFLIIIMFILGLQPSLISQENKSDNLLPSSFSWTDINGINYVTVIKDQSPAPTCEAYALCAAIETLMQFETGTLFNPDLSEAHLFYYSGGTYEKGGVNVYDAADYLINYGVPDEGCFPDPHRPFDFPFSSIDGWENRTMKISEWGWVPHDQESIKKALIDYGPLTICIFVYDDMYSYKEGVYWKTGDSVRVGGHLVALVGWNDSTQSWLIKNSWGSAWGDNGWFHMGYDESMFIDGCYGGETGIIYIDGIYGNTDLLTPKITIKKPQIKHTYLFNKEFYSLIPNIPIIQEAASRIIGPINIIVDVEKTEYVEFYLDGIIEKTIIEPPYELNVKLSRGLHTIETIAYNEHGISKDIVDVFILI